MTDDIITIVPAAVAGKFDAGFKFGLFGRVEYIDEGNVVFASIVGAFDKMAPTFNKGHVAAELSWAAVAVGVKTSFFAGLGKGGEIELSAAIVAVGDAVSEERKAVSIYEPVATFDFAESDRPRLSLGIDFREGGCGTEQTCPCNAGGESFYEVSANHYCF